MNIIKELSLLVFTVLSAAICSSCTDQPAQLSGYSSVIVKNLRCEYLTDPCGIDAANPRLSWVLESDQRGQKQIAYQILVATSAEKLKENKGDLWDCGKVRSDKSIQIKYSGQPLKSQMNCFWKVRVWDKNGKVSQWSKAAKWTMGLLEQADWKGRWITIGKRENEDIAPMFRREFTADKEIKKATAYICGLGYYELSINGDKIGENVLDPGQTDYEHRVFYVTYDVSGNLKKGTNAIGVMLGDGWYNQNKVWVTGAYSVKTGLSYGEPRLLMQIEVLYTDDTRQTIVTDQTWKVTASPILSSNVYAGETYDARLEQPGWNKPAFDDSKWTNVKLIDGPGGKLFSQMLPPIKAMKTIQPVELKNPKPTVYVYNMGQNFAGWARLKVKAKAGTKINLCFAETIHENGMIDPASTGVFATKVVQTDTYICKGTGIEIWEPRFTYHGFQYVEMTGFDGTPNLDNLKGIVVHTAVDKAGSFDCSDSMLNRIHKAAIWTEISNLHSIPTDCPARERCGWTGDAHVSAEMTIYNFDMAGFWTKYIGDIATSSSAAAKMEIYGHGFLDRKIDIKPAGLPTMVVPGKRKCGQASPDWGTAAVQIPWYLYVYYGDEEVLRRNYKNMKQWLEHLESLAKDYIIYEGLGDWCPPGSVPPKDTPIELTSTACFYFDTIIMHRTAELLGQKDEAEKYKQLSGKTKKAFINKFFDYSNKTFGSQTADSLALYLELVPDDAEQDIADSLARDVMEKHKGHHSTGIMGSRHLYWALSNYGHGNVAKTILNQATYPSIGYLFSLGATTLWECWGEAELDKEWEPRSLNHPMQGGFDAWFYSGIAGINPDVDNPGFKHIILKPQLFNELTFAKAEYDSIHGRIVSDWKIEDSKFIWNVTVPVNTTATVYIPAKDVKDVTEGGKSAIKADFVEFSRLENNRAVFLLSSGSYKFTSKLTR
ncbi:MAG: family 78 glycoside hydrolase catalytic domain [Planctomycetota bacterium]|jgi:alpha-L-rhamnosidase